MPCGGGGRGGQGTEEHLSEIDVLDKWYTKHIIPACDRIATLKTRLDSCSSLKLLYQQVPDQAAACSQAVIPEKTAIDSRARSHEWSKDLKD